MPKVNSEGKVTNKTKVVNGVPFTPRSDANQDNGTTSALPRAPEDNGITNTTAQLDPVMNDPMRAKIYNASKERPIDEVDNAEIMEMFHGFSHQIPTEAESAISTGELDDNDRELTEEQA